MKFNNKNQLRLDDGQKITNIKEVLNYHGIDIFKTNGGSSINITKVEPEHYKCLPEYDQVVISNIYGIIPTLKDIIGSRMLYVYFKALDNIDLIIPISNHDLNACDDMIRNPNVCTFERVIGLIDSQNYIPLSINMPHSLMNTKFPEESMGYMIKKCVYNYISGDLEKEQSIDIQVNGYTIPTKLIQSTVPERYLNIGDRNSDILTINAINGLKMIHAI